MNGAPIPGMPVVVVLRTPRPVQWQGEVVAVRETSLAVSVKNAPESWDPNGPYVVICGTPGSRLTAQAHLVARNGEVTAFKVLGNWKPLDLRRDQRFATDLRVEVRSVLGSSRQQGRLIDVSLGGAAAVVESRPGGSQVEIGIAAQGYSARLLCDLVGSSQVGDETVIHLRFKDLTPPHQAFVRNLVAWLLETEERAS
ncbi:PilZ domain-containing protein [Candidatus Amarobacter glycogenicus]|uniref:PilZ domain-containing protein n=1 Tax=Candidatus Amarobacter glycogenicus TaxID=3140699 RepID=UPI003134E4E5|nr:PilZ domain-containing protein [Dehalococcoidia bacterium]